MAFTKPYVLISPDDLSVVLRNINFYGTVGEEREVLTSAYDNVTEVLKEAEGTLCTLDEDGEGHRFKDDIIMCRDCGYIDA